MIESLTNNEAWQFLLQHEQDEPAKLVLQASKYPNLPIKLIAAQIGSRQKAKIKLPTWYKTEGVIFPTGTPLEQCSSEASALYKSQLISGKSLLDLTGGTGIDTFFMAKNFDEAVYIEQQVELAELAQHNFKRLASNHIRVENQQAEAYLANHANKQFDYIYIDPARRDEHNRKMHSLKDCTPDVLQLLPSLKKMSKGILIKTSPLLDIHKALEELEQVNSVHVVSVNNECKEVLYWVDGFSESTSKLPKVHCINIKNTGEHDSFSFDYQEETDDTSNFSQPLAYLYEPNASIMKAGAFKSIAQRFGLYKLHANSHVYTSANLVEDFPGRVFKYLNVLKPDKKSIQNQLPAMKAQITVRNYPQSVEEIRKKTGLKDGGSFYILATTLFDNKPAMLLTEKV